MLSLNAYQIGKLRTGLSGFIVDPNKNGDRVEDLRGLNWIGNKSFKYVSHYALQSITIGLTAKSAKALEDLARSLRLGSPELKRGVNDRDFINLIITYVKDCYFKETQIDEDNVCTHLIRSLQSLSDTLKTEFLHLVPCAIIEGQARYFEVGPVRFTHKTNFEPVEFGFIEHSDLAKISVLMEHIQERGAHWVATVRFSGFVLNRSIEIADLLTDSALGALQILFGFQKSTQRFSRTTGRMMPARRIRLSHSPSGALIQQSWDSAGLGISAENFEQHIRAEGDILSAMGRRLTDYVSMNEKFPLLNEAWCSAAYWYHEALSEELSSVAVVKMETAIEVLFCAASTKLSKARILQGFKAFYGLNEHDFIDKLSTMKVQQIVKSITESRSRVLHGTLPTFGTDLAEVIKDSSLTLADIEAIARVFMIEYALKLDDYKKYSLAEDNANRFLSWIAQQELPTTA